MRTLLQPYTQLVLVCVLLGLVGCAVERGKVYVKDGKTYGVAPDLTWRGRWWDYYQRGLSYAAGEYWPEAIADLQAALGQRQADQRDARTYGLHFLDYFPHRELGIVYYHLGDYATAIHELEASLTTVDTAKAKFYLNKARREEFKQPGRTTAAPQVQIDSPVDGLWTNQLSVTVTGRAEGDAFVAAVGINGEALFVELAAPHVPFAQEVPLTDGPNVIEVTAVDLLGRLARQRLTVYVDYRGPLVSLESVEVLGESAPRRVRVAGLITDDSPITRFALAGRTVPVRAENVWEFRQEVTLAADMTYLPFEVEDAAGNVTRGKIALASLPGAPQGTREGRPALPLLPRWASLHLGTVVADLAATPAAPLRTAAQPEQAPPVIRLEELADRQTIYDDKLYLEGEITAASAIVAFSINGASQLVGRLPRQRDSRRLFFGQMVPLQVGENRLHLEATDALGSTTQRDLVVLRKAQEVRQLEARWRIAVLPLEKAGEPAGLGDTAYDYLLAAFVQQARFRLLERARLEDILREQRFSQTAHVDRTTAIQTGKIAAVEGILFGTVAQHKPQTLEVIVHFADVETTEHLASLDVYGEDLELRDVKLLMHGLAWKLQQRFPLVEGMVIERDGERLTVNRGRHDALKQFMKTILFRDSGTVTDPETGKPLGQRIENLGEARIIEVSDAFAQAALLRSAQAHDVHKLDKFITK